MKLDSDVVVLDLGLPGLDGAGSLPAAADILRRLGTTLDIPTPARAPWSEDGLRHTASTGTGGQPIGGAISVIVLVVVTIRFQRRIRQR